MSSSSPSISIFLTPEVASTLGLIARARGVSLAEGVRVACARQFHAGGKPASPLPPKGRTKRVRVVMDPSMVAIVKQLAGIWGVSQSAWIASAVDTLVMSEITPGEAAAELARRRARAPLAPLA